MSIWNGDHGHEHRYVNGAAAQNGKYSTDKHVKAQCRDSDDKNDRRESRGSTARQAVGKASGFLDWLGR